MKKLTKLLIVPVMALTLVGCGKVAVLENGQEAVLKTKAGNISAEDLYEELKNNYAETTLINMIDKLILNDKYEEDDEEKDYVKEQVDQIKESATSAGTTFQAYLTYYGFKTEDELKDAIVLSYRRDLAVKDYLKANIKDKEINKYYEDEIYGDIRAKHILIEADVLDGMTTEEKEKAEKDALNKAKDIIKKLKNGEDFDKLAKENSADKSNASKGGDLGWFNKGEMESTFEEAAFALKKGSYTTTPVKTSYGYHIIYKTDEKAKPKLEEVKDTILETLVEEKLTKDTSLYYQTLEDIRSDYELDFEDEKLKKAYETYVKNLKQNK